MGLGTGAAFGGGGGVDVVCAGRGARCQRCNRVAAPVAAGSAAGRAAAGWQGRRPTPLVRSGYRRCRRRQCGARGTAWKHPAKAVRLTYLFAWMLRICSSSWMPSPAYAGVGREWNCGAKAPTALIATADCQGLISINVPSRTSSHTSCMSRLRMAMQPSVQSRVWKYHSG